MAFSQAALPIFLVLWMIGTACLNAQNQAVANLAQSSQSSIAPRHKIRVDDPALGSRILAQGGRLIADYGSYQLYDVAEVTTELKASSHVEARDEYNTIFLNALPLDTRNTALQAQRKSVKAATSFSGRRLHLVQFAGPILPAWRGELAATGVRVVAYVPQNAYLVYGDFPSITKTRQMAATAAHIQWEGEYLSDYVIHPDARTVDTNGNPRTIGTDLFAIQMVDDPGANALTLQWLEQRQLEPMQTHTALPNYINRIVRLNPNDLSSIAARPDVVSIQPWFTPHKTCERLDQIMAGNLNGSKPSGPGYLAWLAAKGFTQAQFDASGFAVDVSDSGIDNGTTSPGHFSLYPLGDTTKSSRVAYARLEGTPDGKSVVCGDNHGFRYSTLEGWDGHGNINAHIIAGYDSLHNNYHIDSAGYEYGLGVCPFVQVGSSVVFDPDYFTSPNYSQLLTDAYNSGARISNNSWGGGTNGARYDIDAQSYDALVRDVGSQTNNRSMVLVFVAGNDGPDARTMNSPGTAKNVITVGASENVRSLSTANGGIDSTGTDGSGMSDTDANSALDLAYFSSRGPCSDGRKKPDLVAPGTHVTGGVPQSSPPPAATGAGLASACFDGTGVSGLGAGGVGNADNYFPQNQEFFTVSSGTSHAAPAVSGACALVRQYFINQGWLPPSPAMTKAFLMNSARYLTGNDANDTLWSTGQGMGAVNLGTAFDGVPRMLRDQIAADVLVSSGQMRVFTNTVSDTTKPVRVTLAWTDAPGSTFGAAYNNDLDLVVSAGGAAYKGNVFSGAYSVAGGSADTRNNVESVYLPAGTSGEIVVIVSAANVSSTSGPFPGDGPEQDFALLVYNVATSPAAPTISGIQLSGSTVIISFQGVAGVNYTLEYKDSLSAANWIALPNSVTGTAGIVQLQDSTGFQSGRFYRIRVE